MKHFMQLQKHRSRFLGEEYYAAQLSCGLRVLLVPQRGVSKKVAQLAVRYGSIDLAFRTAGDSDWVRTPTGIAHFLEHELFKKQQGDLTQEFARAGASVNAATDYDVTTYYFSTIEEFPRCLALLLELVFEPFFREDIVEAERGIIEQEIRMYQDLPDHRVYRNLVEGLYHHHPVRIDIAGSLESLREITPRWLESCHRGFYLPSNALCAVAGDIDLEATLAGMEKSLESRPDRSGSDRGAPLERLLPQEPSRVCHSFQSAEMMVPRPKLLVGFKEARPVPSGRTLLVRQVLTGLLLEGIFGPAGRLYAKLYEKGIIDEDFSYAYSGYPSFGMSVVGGETDDPAVLRSALEQGLARFRKEGIKERDVARLKRKHLGRLLRALELPDQKASFVLGHELLGVDPFEVPDVLRKVTRRMLSDRLEEHFDFGRHACSVVEPPASR